MQFVYKSNHVHSNSDKGTDKQTNTIIYIHNNFVLGLDNEYTVKPVLRGHLWNKEKVAL